MGILIGSVGILIGSVGIPIGSWAFLLGSVGIMIVRILIVQHSWILKSVSKRFEIRRKSKFADDLFCVEVEES